MHRSKYWSRQAQAAARMYASADSMEVRMTHDRPLLFEALHDVLNVLLDDGLEAAIATGARHGDVLELRTIAAHVETAEWKSQQSLTPERAR